VTVTHDQSPAPSVHDVLPVGPTPPHRKDRRRARRRERRLERAARRPTLRWRVLVATVGAIVLTVCSGMALGVVSWTPSGLSLSFGGSPKASPVVAGTAGVYPSGPAGSISLTVQNSAAAAFEITAVRADLAGLSAGCPGAAWDVGVPGLLPTVPARSEVALPLPVSLRADAPDSCQGATVRFPVRIEGLRHPAVVRSSESAALASPTPSSDAATTAVTPEFLDTTATVTAARLGTPGGTVTLRGGRPEIVPVHPASGPAPTGYEVELLGTGNRASVVCPSAAAAPCLDAAAPPAAERRYVVAARLGAHWHRSSPSLQAWTPPPVPSVDLADGSRPTGTALRLTAAGAASGYDVDVIADGGSPFHTAHVAAGTPLDQTVSAPHLAAGPHRLVAVARYHGWRAPSAGLHLTVSGEGVATPGPSEAPEPVSVEPGPTTVPTSMPTGAPPVVSVPTRTTAAAPTRATSVPSGTSRQPSTVTKQTAAGPPQVPVPAPPVSTQASTAAVASVPPGRVP
jgi:hypothetical protein